MGESSALNPERVSAADAAELAAGTGAHIEIAGREFPAPAAAVVALLDALRSPFVALGASDEVRHLDVLRALYVLSRREGAALEVLRIARARQALSALGMPSDGPGLMVLADHAERVGRMEADLDASVVAFGETLGAFNLENAALEIAAYLAMATGFSMLPDPKDGQKKS